MKQLNNPGLYMPKNKGGIACTSDKIIGGRMKAKRIPIFFIRVSVHP